MRPRLGQHFLVSEPHLARIVAAAEIEPGDRVLEIGPGTGLLTRKLLEAGARVVAIELDRQLVAELRVTLAGVGGELHVIHGDAAKLEWPAFDKLVANLPYAISSPVLFRLLDTDHARSVLTLQKEFADRLVAAPDTPEYSRLSVKAALKSRTKRLFAVPRGAFEPPPRVESACVSIEPAPPPSVRDWALLDDLVDHAFTQRRKMLRASLKEKASSLEVLKALGWATRRPGELSPVEWVQLSNAIANARGRA